MVWSPVFVPLKLLAAIVPVKVLLPAKDCTPVDTTPGKAALAGSNCKVFPVMIAALALGLLSTAPRVVTALPLDAAVTNPLALTVMVAAVKVPTFAFTVASIVAKLPVPDPVTSPVSVMVWSPVFVPLRLLAAIVPVKVLFPAKD